jgi:hypothetical protein
MTMSHTPLRNFFLLACFTVLLANRPLYAQFNSTIEGIVTDQSGAPVPDAKVAIKQVETGIEKNVITNSAGYYVFPSLPPGNYTLTVTAPGFEKLVQGNVTLQPSRVQNVPIKLTVGAITTSVSVTSAPPPSADR